MSGHICKFLIIGGILLASCTTKETERNKAMLQVHLPNVKLVLDPHRMDDAYSMALIGQLVRGLLRFSPRGDVHTDLAESWKESADNLRFTFKLRETSFSDGQRITANHVVMSFARLFHVGAAMGADMSYIAGSQEFRKSGNLTDLGVRALSENEVEFRLAHPSGVFLRHLAVVDCAILPISNYKDSFDALSAKSFSGPYKLDHLLGDRELTIVKWRADAMDSKNPPARIIYRLDDTNAVELAKKGLTDTLDRDPVSLEGRNEMIRLGWRSYPTGLTGEEFIVLNPSNISDEARAYLYSQIDSESLVAAINNSAFLPAYGLIPAGVPGELSKEALEFWRRKQQFPKTLSKKVRFTFEYDENNPTDSKVVSYLKAVWNSPNLNINWKAEPKKEKLKRLFARTCEACLGRKGLDYPDGLSVLGYFKSGYDSNYFHVNNPSIDKGLGEAVRMVDSNAREDRYRALQTEILAHFTIIPLFFGSEASGLWSSKVHTVPPHPMGFHALPLETVEMRQ